MNPKIIVGAFLVLIGAVLLLKGGDVLGAGFLFSHFWATMFIIPVGLFFFWLYFSVLGRKGSGLLIPGGIITTAGIVCQIATLTGGWSYMWPGFVLAPAVGLTLFYWFGYRSKYLLIPITILTALSLLFFTVFSIGTLLSTLSTAQPIIAILIILLGGYLLVSRKKTL